MSRSRKNAGLKTYESYEDLPPLPTMDVLTDTLDMPSWRAMRPVIHNDRCTKCYICWKFCPDIAIAIDDEGYPVVHLGFCKGCGICANECRPEAIEMVRED